jgi:hypothetical protein
MGVRFSFEAASARAEGGSTADSGSVVLTPRTGVGARSEVGLLDDDGDGAGGGGAGLSGGRSPNAITDCAAGATAVAGVGGVATP